MSSVSTLKIVLANPRPLRSLRQSCAATLANDVVSLSV